MSKNGTAYVQLPKITEEFQMSVPIYTLLLLAKGVTAVLSNTLHSQGFFVVVILILAILVAMQ